MGGGGDFPKCSEIGPKVPLLPRTLCFPCLKSYDQLLWCVRTSTSGPYQTVEPKWGRTVGTRTKARHSEVPVQAILFPLPYQTCYMSVTVCQTMILYLHITIGLL